MKLEIGTKLFNKSYGETCTLVNIIERDNDLNLYVFDFGHPIKTICGKKYSTATYREDYIISKYFEI